MDAIPAALIPTAVLLVESPGGNLLDANRAATQGLGYSLRQMQRLCLADLLAGSGRDGDQVLQDIAASDAPTAFSADVAAKGERRRYRFLAQPSVGANRSVVLLVGMDVTDELAHTRSLETDARRLRALIESNFDAYYDWHMAEGFHEWSPQMDELVGLETGTFPNSLQAWIERLHPSEQEAVVARLMASVDRGGPYHDEYLLRREDGEYRLVSDRGVLLLDEEGRPSDLVGVIRDITQERAAKLALEASEELYRTLFQATNNPALRTDEKGHCIDANEAAVAFFGATREDLVRTTIDEHFGPRALDTLRDLSLASSKDRGAVTVELTAGQGEDQRALVVSVIPSPVSGTLTYFWLGTDVTGLRRLNAALEESQESLRTQAKALEERSVALKVILEQGRQERLDLERAIQDNVERLIAPMLDRLGRYLAERPEASWVEAVRQTLNEIARPFGSPESSAWGLLESTLTRRELEVARLVQMDRSTDEIALILHVSSATVSYHRKRIRRKLGLDGKRIRLAEHLFGLRREQSSHHQGYTVVTGNASSGHVNLLVQPGDEER